MQIVHLNFLGVAEFLKRVHLTLHFIIATCSTKDEDQWVEVTADSF